MQLETDFTPNERNKQPDPFYEEENTFLNCNPEEFAKKIWELLVIMWGKL